MDIWTTKEEEVGIANTLTVSKISIRSHPTRIRLGAVRVILQK
jgi:hypothetical protein